MIAFSVLMLVMGVLICLTSYWISWEIQDTKARPAFGATLQSDWTRLLDRIQLRGGVRHVQRGKTGASRSALGSAVQPRVTSPDRPSAVRIS